MKIIIANRNHLKTIPKGIAVRLIVIDIAFIEGNTYHIYNRGNNKKRYNDSYEAIEGCSKFIF